MQQKWLQAPASYLKSKSTKNRAKGKGNAKRGRRVEDEEEDATGWSHRDGLEGAERVALIIGLFEDAAGCMNATLRWFARPGAVWGEQGPEDDEKVEDVSFSSRVDTAGEGLKYVANLIHYFHDDSMSCTILLTLPTSKKSVNDALGL